ncbi:MAG: ABC transporter ATP-binding protein [Clostridiales bacterium]|jgi:ATP-binding cassette subfamily B multidrug efflux pump|nr:ABC transporter ATP-binding protein [Clostridiales bacterium]
MRRLARYLKYFKKEVIIGPFFKFMEAVFELIVPLVMASIIDVGIKNGDKAYVLGRGGIILLLGAMGLIFALICQYSAARASQGVGTMLRNDLFAHINTLSHGELDKVGTNSLITIITNDVNQIQLAVAMLIRLVVRAPFLVIGSIVMAMLLDIQLSFIFLIVAPLVSLVLYIVMKKSVPYYKLRQKTLDRVSLITRENLSGARVIRAFSKQEREEKRFEEANHDVAELAIRVGKISAVLNPATFTILNTAILAIIWFGGIRVNIGSLTQGEVIAFVNYMTQISLALVVVANLVVIFTKAGASANRINHIFDLMPSIQEGSVTGQADFDVRTPIFSLEKVSFAYPDSDEYALEDITLEIMSGETIGIIGGTGSGKTTLINLLPRFYDVSQGDICMDGVPLKEYSFEYIRKQFGIVPQKAVLFSGSIIDNMCWGKEDASLEEIKWAIQIAQAKEFVEKLPEQYETMILQGGKNLSGGQRQRLTIARALVGNPRILVLDDSSSALDYATDARLRKSLKENCKGMTTILVSQRANTIRHADKIIVLDDGRIAGIGKHKDLLETCEVYKEICLSQLSKEEVYRS